ncbi:MAG TPA: efflux RND transporter periplasmic adaptor subunit [Planctomycetes bacterium]|nr:efflux RND transporter periplasmic adaptor subunit [Planctomycetota bacterium]HIK81705.1 efflux RND transporter periplasmic adaptor subunit [Planctomycetota bacterium]
MTDPDTTPAAGGESPRHDLSRLKIDRTRRTPSSRWPILLPLMLIVGYIAWKELPSGVPSQDPEVITSRVQRRGGASDRTGVASNGYIVPRRRASLSTDIPGRLIEMNVEEGTRVERGDVVARLDSRELQASLARLEADRDGALAEQERARLALERQQSLSSTDDLSRSELDTARATARAASARVASLTASIAEIETRIDKSTVYAPFSGVVVEKNAEVGEVVSSIGGGANARGSVATLVDFDTLEVQIELAQTTLDAARIGAPVLIYLDAYPQQGYRGRIRQVWPTANRSKATVELRAEFIDRDEKLIPELGVRVVFVPESEANPTPPQVLLSKKALLLSESPTVLVVRNGIIEVRAITLRDDLGDDLIEVGSGLIGGETVVIDPDPTLKSGDRVQVRRP